MAKEKRSFVVGVFEESTQAQQTMEELRHAGFRDDQIKFSKPGVATDSLSNDLIDMGAPRGEVRFYEQELAAGRTIVTVIAAGRHQDVLDMLARSGATNATTRPAQQHLNEPEGDLNIQLRKEQLQANKHVVERGEVGLRKEVVSEQQTLNVPVTHEEVYIERRPGLGQVSQFFLSPGYAFKRTIVTPSPPSCGGAGAYDFTRGWCASCSRTAERNAPVPLPCKIRTAASPESAALFK